MPEGRILLKRIAQSKKLAALKTDGARLLYTWTLPHLDINGCFHGDAEILNGLIFTRLNKDVEEVEEYLKDIEANGLIVRYDSNGDTYQIYPDFEDKQPKLQRNKEAKPSIPLPTPEQLPTNSGVRADFPGTSKAKQSKGKQIKEQPSAASLHYSDQIETNYVEQIDKLCEWLEKKHPGFPYKFVQKNCKAHPEAIIEVLQMVKKYTEADKLEKGPWPISNKTIGKIKGNYNERENTRAHEAIKEELKLCDLPHIKNLFESL
jgi:hypothetical protein